jgi:hypothetical protein
MKKIILKSITIVLLLLWTIPAMAQGSSNFNWAEYIDRQSEERYEKVVVWRRHFHQYPELSNREFETAKVIEAHLRKLMVHVRGAE